MSLSTVSKYGILSQGGDPMQSLELINEDFSTNPEWETSGENWNWEDTGRMTWESTYSGEIGIIYTPEFNISDDVNLTMELVMSGAHHIRNRTTIEAFNKISQNWEVILAKSNPGPGFTFTDILSTNISRIRIIWEATEGLRPSQLHSVITTYV